MKNNNASILLEKYQIEKRKRILRYSARPTNANISTLSTNVHSRLSCSKESSNIENFELSFMLSSFKSVPVQNPASCGYHLDGADRFAVMKENKNPTMDLKKILAGSQKVIVQRVPEKLAARYLNGLKNNKDKTPNIVSTENENRNDSGSNDKNEIDSKKQPMTKIDEGDSDYSDGGQQSGFKFQHKAKNKQINSVDDSSQLQGSVIPDTLYSSDIENTPIKKKRGHQIGGNRTSLLISVENPFGNLQQLVGESVNEALPFTMKEFPEDVSPSEFFAQKQSTYHSYIESIRKTISFVPTLSLYHFHKDFNIFFTPFTILSKSSKGQTTKSYFNMSASYFLVNCSEVVQLYFAYEMIMYYLTAKKPIPLFITHKDFDRVLSKLNGEVDMAARMSVLSKKSFQRKSMFSNQKVNFVFEDLDENSDSPQKSEPRKEQSTGQHQPMSITPFQVNGISIHELAQVKEVGGEMSGSGSDQNSKSNDSNSSNSDSNSDDSDSDASSDSLDETEYSTKNPFVIKYSKIAYKFQTYELKVIPAFVCDASDQTEKLTAEMIFDLLYEFNEFNFDFFIQ
jgi:hypothetical protein